MEQEPLPVQPEITDRHQEKPAPRFDIEPVIEQRSFEQPAVQKFFTEWCDANDSITPVYVSREAWDERVAAGQMLADEPAPEGKRELAIPTDLRLYEMVDVMGAVDADTFRDHPEKAAAHRDKIARLGETFTDAGVYLAQRLNAVQDQGAPKELAEHLASQFFNYGQSLIAGHRGEVASIDKIAAQPQLDSEHLEQMDRWMVGDRLYEARRARALVVDSDDSTDPIERVRRETLNQFFRVSAKAFELQQRDQELKPAPDRKLWQSDWPVHAAFTQKIEAEIERRVETPKQELSSAVFRRGMDLLQSNIGFESLPRSVKANILHWEGADGTLRGALHIDEMRAELEHIKEGNDSEAIAAKERQIADKIQAVVSGYRYKESRSSPAEILSNEQLNCVGFSTVGGALMEEAGLNYLVVSMPEHSTLMLVTSDGQLEWRDMQDPRLGRRLDDDDIGGSKPDGSELTVADIVDFSRSQSGRALSFEVPLGLFRSGAEAYRKIPQVAVSRPQYGQEVQVLDWVGGALMDVGQKEAALVVYERALALRPDDPLLLSNMGDVLSSLKRNEEALNSYKSAIAIDPEYADAYRGIGDALDGLTRLGPAAEAYRKAMEMNPKENIYRYDLAEVLGRIGRTDEAIGLYKSFLREARKSFLKEAPKSFFKKFAPEDVTYISEAKEDLAKLKGRNKKSWLRRRK